MSMVNSISSVRFCGDTTGANALSRPGRFSGGDAQQTTAATTAPADKPKKSGGKKFLKFVATLVVIAGVLAALPKVFPKAIKTLDAEALKNAKTMDKVGHYLAKTGEAIISPFTKLFKKKPAAPAAPAPTPTPTAPAA